MIALYPGFSLEPLENLMPGPHSRPNESASLVSDPGEGSF